MMQYFDLAPLLSRFRSINFCTLGGKFEERNPVKKPLKIDSALLLEKQAVYF